MPYDASYTYIPGTWFTVYCSCLYDPDPARLGLTLLPVDGAFRLVFYVEFAVIWYLTALLQQDPTKYSGLEARIIGDTMGVIHGR